MPKLPSKEELKKRKETVVLPKIKELEMQQDEEGNYFFYGATTLPDRVKGVNYHGQEYDGEIFSKEALQDITEMINDKSKLGGDVGSYRTISLFHNRVYEQNPKLEEAGYIVGDAQLVPLENYPNHWGVKIPVEVNKYFEPPKNYEDYTPDKIDYKIQKGAIGLSIEYNNTKDQEVLVEIGDKSYNFIKEVTDFRGFGFARAAMIGNTTAVRVKEIGEWLNKGEQMEEAKIKELESQLSENRAKMKEVISKIEALGKDDSKVKELAKQKEEIDAKIKELDLKSDEFASKVKEQIEASLNKAFASVNVKMPKVKEDEDEENEVGAKVKEIVAELASPKVKELGNVKVKQFSWDSYTEHMNAKIKENEQVIKDQLLGNGIRFDTNRTLKVKCVGRTVVVEPTEMTKKALQTKTKDVIDTGSMSESTYYQTNAFFADRYTPGITETFLMSDSLLKAMIKEGYMGGNDKYQWKIWTEFGNFLGTNTAAVDPNTTSVQRTKRDFIKLETPIREYRDGVEVTDFTQAHAASVVDLMGEEINRAAEYVTNSMNADLFKQYVDSAAAWNGFNGLLGIADSGTYTSIYGRVRSAANRLLDATLANTYVTTSEDFSMSVARNMYEKVLAQGSNLAQIAFVAHPTQIRLLFDKEDAAIRNNQLTMAGAPPSFGFSRALVPHIDGIPVIRDYYCTDASGNADTVAVVDLGPNGFVLVTSKPLDVRGLAKVGTSESAYVSFWGQAVYKRPRNICLHDSLTTA